MEYKWSDFLKRTGCFDEKLILKSCVTVVEIGRNNMNQKEEIKVVVKIKDLAARERKITSEILDCIRKINAQKIFLELGYPSLLEFLGACPKIS